MDTAFARAAGSAPSCAHVPNCMLESRTDLKKLLKKDELQHYSPIHGKSVDGFFFFGAKVLKNHGNLDWCQGKDVKLEKC